MYVIAFFCTANSNDNDVVLYRIPYTAYTPEISPICLPTGGDYVDQTATVAGWGKLTQGANSILNIE